MVFTQKARISHLILPPVVDLGPFATRFKCLPSIPEVDRVTELELENQDLRRKVRLLQRQVEVQAHQITCHRQISYATKPFVRAVLTTIEQLRVASSTMETVEHEAEGICKHFENESARGASRNFI